MARMPRTDWRRNPVVPSRQTISVWEPSKDSEEERAKKIEGGAHVVPFGFARALIDEVAEPLLWEGDDS